MGGFARPGPSFAVASVPPPVKGGFAAVPTTEVAAPPAAVAVQQVTRETVLPVAPDPGYYEVRAPLQGVAAQTDAANVIPAAPAAPATPAIEYKYDMRRLQYPYVVSAGQAIAASVSVPSWVLGLGLVAAGAGAYYLYSKHSRSRSRKR